jgi:hypothetical protein
MTDLYRPRTSPPTSLPGGVHRAFYRWEGNITREQFDAVPNDMRGPGCVHCDHTRRYQVRLKAWM